MNLTAKRLFDTVIALSSSRRRKAREWEELRALLCSEQNRREGIFDEGWYRASYPDVAAEGVDPAFHYVRHGARENRRPGPNFDGAFYLQTYPDAVAAGENPLVSVVRTFGTTRGVDQRSVGLVLD